MTPALVNQVVKTIESETSLLGASIELLTIIERLSYTMPPEQCVAFAEFARNAIDRIEHCRSKLKA